MFGALFCRNVSWAGACVLFAFAATAFSPPRTGRIVHQRRSSWHQVVGAPVFGPQAPRTPDALAAIADFAEAGQSRLHSWMSPQAAITDGPRTDADRARSSPLWGGVAPLTGDDGARTVDAQKAVETAVRALEVASMKAAAGMREVSATLERELREGAVRAAKASEQLQAAQQLQEGLTKLQSSPYTSKALAELHQLRVKLTPLEKAASGLEWADHTKTPPSSGLGALAFVAAAATAVTSKPAAAPPVAPTATRAPLTTAASVLRTTDYEGAHDGVTWMPASMDHDADIGASSAPHPSATEGLSSRSPEAWVPYIGFPSDASDGEAMDAASPSRASTRDQARDRDDARDREGFDVALSVECARLCGTAYHSCEPEEEGVQRRIDEDLQAHHLELVAQVTDPGTDGYAMIAANATDLYVVFRGTCTIKNVLTDIDYRAPRPPVGHCGETST